MGKFNMKVSIVTGAARGLGRAPREAGSPGQGLCTRIPLFCMSLHIESETGSE